MPKLNPDYDPDWKSRFDHARAKVDATHNTKDLEAMHRAFSAQFRTMAEIRDFHFDSLRKKAEIYGLELLLPELGDDCTREEIGKAYGRGDDAINDHLAERYRKPYAHPADLNAFHDDDPDVQRFTERYEYVGFRNHSSVCILTIEYQEAEAHVCFTLVEDGGTSPINMMDHLATIVYHEQLFDRYEPEEVHWYAYFRFRGLDGREGFMEAILEWNRKRKCYSNVRCWEHFPSAPRVIGETADVGTETSGVPRVRPRSDQANDDTPDLATS